MSCWRRNSTQSDKIIIIPTIITTIAVAVVVCCSACSWCCVQPKLAGSTPEASRLSARLTVFQPLLHQLLPCLSCCLPCSAPKCSALFCPQRSSPPSTLGCRWAVVFCTDGYSTSPKRRSLLFDSALSLSLPLPGMKLYIICILIFGQLSAGCWMLDMLSDCIYMEYIYIYRYTVCATHVIRKCRISTKIL